MPARKQFLQQLRLMAGAFSANSLFNQLHAAEIVTASKKINHLSSTDGMAPGELDTTLFNDYTIHTVGIVWDNISCVRITPHVYTRLQDLDKLVKAIGEIAGKK